MTQTNQDSKNWEIIGSVVFLIVVILMIGQYGNKRIAWSLAGLIFLSALTFNIDKLKGVFTSA